MTAALEDRVAGALLGTALGDALGLPCEGMRPRTIVRRFGLVDRFHLLGRTGFVSDDTEQTALLAQSLTTSDFEVAERRFRRALAGWFLRLPWGIGLSTLKACVLIVLGVKNSGRPSAGNGAAMRAAAVGLRFHGDAVERRRFGRRLAEVTHRDARAVEGALFVGEVVAGCVVAESSTPREEIVRTALEVVAVAELRDAIEGAIEADGDDLPTTGYVVDTLAVAARDFVRLGDRPLPALQHCIGRGGDTDTIAAILGAWLGALHGASVLPSDLLDRIHDGPFGPSHLRALAVALASGGPAPHYRWWTAMVRNLLLYPVVLAHGFRRLWPF